MTGKKDPIPLRWKFDFWSFAIGYVLAAPIHAAFDVLPWYWEVVVFGVGYVLFVLVLTVVIEIVYWFRVRMWVDRNIPDHSRADWRKGLMRSEESRTTYVKFKSVIK